MRRHTRVGSVGLSSRNFDQVFSMPSRAGRRSTSLEGGSVDNNSIRCFRFANFAPARRCFSSSSEYLRNVCGPVRTRHRTQPGRWPNRCTIFAGFLVTTSKHRSLDGRRSSFYEDFALRTFRPVAVPRSGIPSFPTCSSHPHPTLRISAESRPARLNECNSPTNAVIARSRAALQHLT